MLKSHMNAIEESLLAISKIPANSGHSLHKGTPREAFIKEFLSNHLPENVSIGTGEIIDFNSKPREPRNQFDIVIYKKNYPKLDFGGGISGFLIESVIATIEVKSILDKAGIEQSITASKKCKSLSKSVTESFSTGYIPPKVLNYVVAYDGPASVKTTHKWIKEVLQELNITQEDLSLDPNTRRNTPSHSLDGVFVLKKGFIYFDNLPMGFASDATRNNFKKLKWVMADSDVGNLLLLFLFLQQATANIQGQWLNPNPYLSKFSVNNLSYGE